MGEPIGVCLSDEKIIYARAGKGDTAQVFATNNPVAYGDVTQLVHFVRQTTVYTDNQPLVMVLPAEVDQAVRSDLLDRARQVRRGRLLLISQPQAIMHGLTDAGRALRERDRVGGHKLILTIGHKRLRLSVVTQGREQVTIDAHEHARSAGGEAWLSAVADYIAERFLAEQRIDPRGALRSSEQQALMEAAGELRTVVRQSHSARRRVEAVDPATGKPAMQNVSLDEQTLNEILKPLAMHVQELISRVARRFVFAGQPVDEVLALGALASDPVMTELLSSSFHADLLTIDPRDPDELAALGAARIAGRGAEDIAVATPAASIQPMTIRYNVSGRERRLHVLVADQIKFGRHSKQNEVALVLQPATEFRAQNAKIGLNGHFQFIRQNNEVLVKDLQPKGGTWVNDLRLDGLSMTLPNTTPSQIEVARVLKLRARPHRPDRRQPDQLHAVHVERVDNLQHESYLMLFHVAVLGMDDQGFLRLHEGNDRRPTICLLRHANRIEALVSERGFDSSELPAEEHRLSLRPGVAFELAGTQLAITAFEQIGMEQRTAVEA